VYDTSWQGEVPLLDATAVLDEESGAVTLFAVNRDQDQPLTLSADVRALPSLATGEHVVITDDDPDAVNTADDPERVTPRRLEDVKVTDGRAEIVLPPLSWSIVTLHPAR
jgi:alpha-N-arabinofuranosidase